MTLEKLSVEKLGADKNDDNDVSEDDGEDAPDDLDED